MGLSFNNRHKPGKAQSSLPRFTISWSTPGIINQVWRIQRQVEAFCFTVLLNAWLKGRGGQLCLCVWPSTRAPSSPRPLNLKRPPSSSSVKNGNQSAPSDEPWLGLASSGLPPVENPTWIKVINLKQLLWCYYCCCYCCCCWAWNRTAEETLRAERAVNSRRYSPIINPLWKERFSLLLSSGGFLVDSNGCVHWSELPRFWIPASWREFERGFRLASLSANTAIAAMKAASQTIKRQSITQQPDLRNNNPGSCCSRSASQQCSAVRWKSIKTLSWWPKYETAASAGNSTVSWNDWKLL